MFASRQPCLSQLEKEALKSVGAFSKTVSRELKKEADILANGLLKKCGEAKRDISGITTVISDLRSKTAALKPAQSVDLMKDWRLVFVTDDDTLSTVGTGLHKLPLTRMQVSSNILKSLSDNLHNR